MTSIVFMPWSGRATPDAKVHTQIISEEYKALDLSVEMMKIIKKPP